MGIGDKNKNAKKKGNICINISNLNLVRKKKIEDVIIRTNQKCMCSNFLDHHRIRKRSRTLGSSESRRPYSIPNAICSTTKNTMKSNFYCFCVYLLLKIEYYLRINVIIRLKNLIFVCMIVCPLMDEVGLVENAARTRTC